MMIMMEKVRNDEEETTTQWAKPPKKAV